jgi:hypothetical protein
MSTNRTLAIIATLASLIAAPAYALDQDTAAVTVNSGRYFGQQTNIPWNAYGWVHESNHIARPAAPERDFQLEGRGLGGF